MRYLFQISLSVLLLATIARAQTLEQSQGQKPEQSWENLRTLRVGEKIQVVDQKLKSQNGTFVAFSDDVITFQADKDEVAIQRADVLRVTSRERSKRKRNALIGLAVGAAAGAAALAAPLAGNCCNPDVGSAGVAIVVGAGAALAGGVGAAVGAAIPSGHPTIYRAERRKDQTAP